jgi:hypothetical protein
MDLKEVRPKNRAFRISLFLENQPYPSKGGTGFKVPPFVDVASPKEIGGCTGDRGICYIPTDFSNILSSLLNKLYSCN